MEKFDEYVSIILLSKTYTNYYYNGNIEFYNSQPLAS